MALFWIICLWILDFPSDFKYADYIHKISNKIPDNDLQGNNDIFSKAGSSPII